MFNGVMVKLILQDIRVISVILKEDPIKVKQSKSQIETGNFLLPFLISEQVIIDESPDMCSELTL